MRTRTIALAAALWAAWGGAEAQEAAMMEHGLTRLEGNVAGTFRRHGVDVDPRSLTLNQVARIIQLQSSRDDSDPQLTRSQLLAVTRNRRSFSPGD